MNNDQCANIQIRKEITEFLELQINGQHCNKCKSRFTEVQLSDDAKQILKVIEHAIYFGDQTHALDDLNRIETQRVLAMLMLDVSVIEKNLVYYILLIVANNQDQTKFDLYERTYRRMLAMQGRSSVSPICPKDTPSAYIDSKHKVSN
jgi:hypothetical protein